MKTKLIALALVLVIAAVAIVCVSCTKKEKEYPAELISFSVVNKTGESITSLVMDDTRMVSRMETKPLGGGWADGESISFSMTAAMENNAPNLQLTITTDTGKNLTTSVLRKNITITVLSGEYGLRTEESDLAE